MTATFDVAEGGAPLAAAPLTRSSNDEGGERLSRGSGLGLGIAVIWLSLLVLIPLAAVVAKGFGGGWSGFWTAITRTQALDALWLTVWTSLLVAAVNAVMGTLIAWVLVRDKFRGSRLIDIVIDIPFALPTIVAGVVLLSVYGTNSPVAINLLGTQRGIAFAMLFVTLPFVVRSVQPVLAALDLESEQAAACLGAGPLVIFRRIVLPLLLPAIASGAALAFARAMGEYGTVLLIGGGLDRTKVASMYAFQLHQAFDDQGAAAVATVLLVISLVVILSLDLIQRRMARRG
ncbi:MAG TPA: sulfate ABC transporter permease subunit CysT [Jatrophihabitantaceae bacterium]|jgi:sulfate transport system permease protein|nr:sulfate ABC transporter permease subunit CysT [Jatrophihabitantaceae bacterium]